MKRFISLILSMALVVAVLAVPAFAETTKDNTVIINGASITIGSNYGSDEKLWLQFGPCGPNSLTQLNVISKSAADATSPTSTWLSSGTDWVGPVFMKARDAADDTAIYAGGWHKKEADGSPSAKSESVVFKVDGEVQTGNVTLDGSKVEIIVTNELYTGTTAATGASGLREVVHYTISGNVVDVENTLTALNDVTITQYFGLQSVSRTYTADMIQFTNGQENSYVGGYYTHVSGTKAAYPDVNAVVHSSKDGDRLVMTLDRTVGLGNLDYLLESHNVATHANTNKAYFNLVSGIPCEVDKGDSVQWKGQYLFEKLPVSSAVMEDYNALTRESLVSEASTDATVSANLTLPIKGANGSTILWETTNNEVISETGVVKTPDLTTSVTLTATIFDGKGASKEKAFSFRVPGAEGPVDSSGTKVMPEKGALIRSDNFDDNSMDATTITSIQGNVKEENGVLHFKRTEASDGDVVSATVYLKADKTPIYGSSILEFTMTKNNTYTGLTAYINGSNGQYLQISALANKQMSISYGGGKKDLSAAEVGTDTLNFKIAFDSGKGQFRLWLNDKFICAEKCSAAPAGLSNINFLQSKATGLTTDVNVDNLAVYHLKTPGRVLYQDDFDDGKMAKNISVLNAGQTTVKEENGVLKAGTSVAASSSVTLLADENGVAKKGKFAIELMISRTSCTDALDVYFNGSSGKIFHTRWWNSVLYKNWASVKDGAAANQVSNSVSNAKLHLFAEINTNTEEISLWMNGVYLGSGYSAGSEDLASISIAAFATSCDPVVEYISIIDLTDEFGTSIVQYQNSFDGGTVSGQVELSNMTQTGGSLVTTDRESTSTATVYLKEDKSAVTGDFSIEFNTSRAFANATTDLYVFGEDGNRYTTIRWWSINNATYASVEYLPSVGAGKTATSYAYYSTVDNQNSMHVKATFHTANSTFSVWINGHEIVRNVLSSHGANSVVSLSLQNVFTATGGNSGYGNASLHDFLFYSQMPGLGLSDFSVDYNAYDKKVSVASPVSGSACVLVASYLGDTLVSAVPKTVTLVAHDDVLVDTSALRAEQADRVVIYLWDSDSSLQPLCEAQKVLGAIETN